MQNSLAVSQELVQKIILDLKGKINFDEESVDQSVSEKKNNVTIALKSLGYNNAEIKQALNGLDLSDAVSLSDAVKNALKALKKK